jgi:GDPmannose 4,6-dehydratase
MTKALITGITGQDGSYLAEFLLEKGYEVHGIIRRSSSFNTGRIDHIFDRLNLHYGDMTDGTNLINIMSKIDADEIYNLAAQSHVQVSFETPEYTAQADALGTLKLLEAERVLKTGARIYQASTSEMFGSSPAPQNENTPFHPCSPYGTAKLYAYWICRNYREAYGIHVSSGIMFNHESPRRGDTFVTKKVVNAVAKIQNNKQDLVTLGNINSKRDWGHAKDYVEAMWLMTQQDNPSDYVIATNTCYTVRDMVEYSFNCIGMNIHWEGTGVNELGIDSAGKIRVKIDPKYYRPNEVDHLMGNPFKAMNVLGWKPKISFQQLISEMVNAEVMRSLK